MVERINLLRNVGQFDAVTAGALLPLRKLALIYAENGRGKTTLATILRSLSTGEAKLISDRRRLGATQLPQVVVQAGTTNYTFQNGTWSAPWPHVAVFDDTFVAENVCSGIEIESEHRQNLHELILGAQGVALNKTLQGHIARIEQHNQNLRIHSSAIPATARGSFSVDDFCALEEYQNIAQLIQGAQRNLTAARSSDKVRQTDKFAPLQLPRFDVDTINAVLRRDLVDLDADAAVHVQAHLVRIGPRGEAWAAEGASMISAASVGRDHEACPFCSQDLRNSTLIQHYRSYFSAAYSGLKQTVADQIRGVSAVHGGDAPGAFERSVSVALQRREFWRTLTDVPEFNIDTAAINRIWKEARDAVLEILHAKQAAPLEALELSQQTVAAINNYHAVCCNAIAEISNMLLAANPLIDLIKERTATADTPELEATLAKLKATEARYSPTAPPLCQRYLDEKAAKVATERLRDTARAALDQYRQTVFPAYETTINTYLQRFNAGFRLGGVTSVNSRTGSSCTYNVVINNTPVAATTNDGAAFRNTLSAGDRNTLALAFFFASLEQDPHLQQKTVVIDDPMTSLDEHRTLATLHEIRRLVDRANQLIVLSHSKTFLCRLWENAERTARSAIMIARDGAGSTLTVWDVTNACATEHDRRHALITEYIQRANPTKERDVAAALRLTLEGFMRVAYPDAFPPGSLLGAFIHNICRPSLGTANQVLSQHDIHELQHLLDYGNTFHHDTNAAWQTIIINDQELVGFCRRVLNFTRRG